MTARELCFDGLVGPTHGFGALAPGNRASQASRARPSSPRRAALQGLAKMRRVAELGVPQAFLPPPPRPHWAFLRRMGFRGPRAELLARAARERSSVLAAACSAASMWTANAATVSPSVDSGGRVQITPANLGQMAHRAIEAETTARLLRAALPGPHFEHHPPLPASAQLGDEGAANHSRFCRRHGDPGVQLFCFGHSAMPPRGPAPRVHPARQSREACEALVRLHRLDPARSLLAQVAPRAIDAGVFHADVICVANRDVFLLHERAFVEQASLLRELEERCRAVGTELVVVRVAERELSLDAAVETYLFNSQLLSLDDGTMALVSPAAVRRHPDCRRVVERILADPANPIDTLHTVELDESLHNGGGPACLRLRVVLEEAELAAVRPELRWSEERGRRLEHWVERHYPERLTLPELADPGRVEALERALEELYAELGMSDVLAELRAITDGEPAATP